MLERKVISPLPCLAGSHFDGHGWIDHSAVNRSVSGLNGPVLIRIVFKDHLYFFAQKAFFHAGCGDLETVLIVNNGFFKTLPLLFLSFLLFVRRTLLHSVLPLVLSFSGLESEEEQPARRRAAQRSAAVRLNFIIFSFVLFAKPFGRFGSANRDYRFKIPLIMNE